METLIVLFVITLVFGMTLASHWIDNKYNLQLAKWLNCEVSSPFRESLPGRDTSSQKSAQNIDTEELRERIENLEKIVTDSSWELNQKINKL